MAHSGRIRHRDREPPRRDAGDDGPRGPRAFRMTEAQREDVAASLRAIDDARLELERQHNAANRAIVRGLRASADHIYDILNELEVLDHLT